MIHRDVTTHLSPSSLPPPLSLSVRYNVNNGCGDGKRCVCGDEMCVYGDDKMMWMDRVVLELWALERASE